MALLQHFGWRKLERYPSSEKNGPVCATLEMTMYGATHLAPWVKGVNLLLLLPQLSERSVHHTHCDDNRKALAEFDDLRKVS